MKHYYETVPGIRFSAFAIFMHRGYFYSADKVSEEEYLIGKLAGKFVFESPIDYTLEDHSLLANIITERMRNERIEL